MSKTAKRAVAARADKSSPAKRASPAKRKRRSPEELKDRIIAAAGVEFRRGGYAKATTAAIARRAKVTETQIFRYFDSKANLFREAIFKPLDEQILRFFESYPRDGDQAPNFRKDSKTYIADLQAFLSENADMMVSLMAAQRYNEEMAGEAGEIESLNSYFERGAAMMRSSLKSEPRVDPKLMVRVSFAAVLASVIFKDWLFPRGIASEKEIQAAIGEFVLEGLTATHGRTSN